jgi:hypothetical protein
MAFTVEVSDRLSGADLASDTQPAAPAAVAQAGSDQIQVTWALPTATAEELVELHISGELGDGGVSILKQVVVDWDDGSATETYGGFGRSINLYLQHTYTSASPVTIATTISFINNDIELDFTNSITPDISASIRADQVQIEKLEDDVLRYAPDWRNVDDVNLVFTDAEVQRGYRYRYRIRFRTVDALGEPVVTSLFSTVTAAGPWA